MPFFDQSELEKLDKVYRLNLINSCTGYKSANLIGTRSLAGIENLAVFSSVTHLGSHPALLGFILRPTTVPRHTYQNIKSSGIFTVNHISSEIIAPAHQSSANYDAQTSEFEAVGLEKEYHHNLNVPFVKGAPVQLFCRYANEYSIQENHTIHLIAYIEKVFVAEGLLQDDGWLRLDKGKVVAINGLDGYALPSLVSRFTYARPNQPVQSTGGDS